MAIPYEIVGQFVHERARALVKGFNEIAIALARWHACLLTAEVQCMARRTVLSRPAPLITREAQQTAERVIENCTL